MKSLFVCLFAALFAVNASACQFKQISFTTNFSGGNLSKCHQVDANSYVLYLAPENLPINDSPWYAFQVKAKESMKVNISLKTIKGKHNRYPPKASDDGVNWQPIKHKFAKNKLKFSLNVSEQALWVAGQEVINNAFYLNWGQKLATKANAKHDVIGWSVQERPLYMIEHKAPQSKKWLVILGRMHPPEVTGALALLSFSETLFSDSNQAKQFREKFNILLVPNINPDGVYLGNWRHNANGKDLNRQWNSFDQPEVKAVDDYLTKLVKQGGKIKFAVDFHSTHKDIFYTMPTDYGVMQPYFVENWLNGVDKLYPNFNVIQKPGNNPDLGVFKQYIADKYNVHAITYEIGDNTDRGFIHHLAVDAAKELMSQLEKPEQYHNGLAN